jgi:putative FmdB family regulatory protein
MPLYDYRCKCGTVQSVIKKIADLDLAENCDNCGRPMERQISAPMIQPDIAGYSCPITGAWIGSRRQHEENLKKHGCRVLEPGEKEDVIKAKIVSETEFERAVGETVDLEISRLPARKRERLASEMEQGMTAEIIRSAPALH